MLETAFHSLDANNDGFVDFYELSGCLQGNAEAFNKIRGSSQFSEAMRQFLASNDANADGKLDKEEFIKAMSKFAGTEKSRTGSYMNSPPEIQVELEDLEYYDSPGRKMD